jgi:hypothetical protein
MDKIPSIKNSKCVVLGFFGITSICMQIHPNNVQLPALALVFKRKCLASQLSGSPC